MTTRPSDLPDFEHPPVMEVALGVQLDPLPLVRSAHLGLLWAQFREEYPTLHEQPPLKTPEEQFDSAGGVVFTVQIFGPPEVPRFWFINPSGDRLIQVQQDRFVHNWRRASLDVDYPRYEALRDSFEASFAIYTDFIEQSGLGRVSIRQAEINYLNHVPPSSAWAGQSQLDDVVPMWRPSYDPHLLTEPVEDVRLTQRHLITDAEGPFARLYVAVEPVVGGALTLNLTVRGKPRGSDAKSALAFFDMGRDRIVKGFTAVTTPRMHKEWGRIK